MGWRTEPTKVENLGDELWIGVKGQSNVEIAGSPRNIFRYGLGIEFHGGRALIGLGGSPAYQPQSNSECRENIAGRQTAGDNVRSQKGNNPDRRLRSLNSAQWERMWERGDNQEVGLEAATLERVRNSSLVQ